jgi:hypothetical protein
MSALDDEVTAALDRVWAKIQRLEPEVPDVRWYLTSGRSSACATGPWDSPDDLVIRINLKQTWKAAAPGLERPRRDVQELLGQLIHWAAHAATGISPGAEGRYHSREFASVAEALGLVIDHKDGVGWAPEMVEVGGHPEEFMTPVTLKRFAPEIRRLDNAMAPWKPETKDAARRQGRGPISMACSCTPPRIFRASTGVALGPDIIDTVCGKPFRITPGQRISEANRR